jgi:hypothetical protein
VVFQFLIKWQREKLTGQGKLFIYFVLADVKVLYTEEANIADSLVQLFGKLFLAPCLSELTEVEGDEVRPVDWTLISRVEACIE